MPELEVPQNQSTQQPPASQGNSPNSNEPPPANPNPLEIQPPVSAPDNRIDVLAGAVNKLAEQQSLILQQLALQNQQHASRNTVVEPKPALPSNDDVWKDPVKAISQIVAAQNAPLNEAAQMLMRDGKYRQLKAQIALSPQWQAAKAKFPGFEDQVDAQAMQVPVERLDINALAFIMSSVVGQMALNTPAVTVPPNNPINPALPNNARPVDMTQLPAHLRPVNPAPAAIKKNDDEPELTENEMIIARRFGMTPKEFKASQSGGALVLDPTKGGA